MAKAKGSGRAKAKSAKKTNGARSPMIGHNSADAASAEELAKIAKSQRTLNKEKRSVQKDWRERQAKIRERLAEIGYTEKQFKAPFDFFEELADAKNDDEAKTIRENHKIFLAQQRKAFNALGTGEQLDWVNLIQDGDELLAVRADEERKREEAERAAAEAAAAGAADAEDAPAQV